MTTSAQDPAELPIVVIGTGLAGYAVARELRKLDGEVPVQLITRDDGCFYSKPMLSNALARGRQPADLVDADAARMAEQLRTRVRAGVQVTALAPEARQVRIGEQHLAYRSLVLALGAEPIRLALGGDAAQQVLSVNDLASYARFRRHLEGARRVAILGAGLIGCEFANDLRRAGFGVDLVDLAAWPLGRLVPEAVGRVLEACLAETGVAWHLGTTVDEVNRAASGLELALANGETLAADLVLSAVGLRPRTRLAAEAGLEVQGGIVTDRFLRTSAEGIFALGDCARVGGLTLPYVMPIMHAARALAKALAGEPTKVVYPAMPVVVKTPDCPLVVCPPPAGVAGRWEIGAEKTGARALFHAADGSLRGFALTGKATGEKVRLAARVPPWLGED